METNLIPSAFLARPMKIVVIGAGISGIQFAHDTTKSLTSLDLEIYDRNPSLGGTWYENRYPGCTCDVPSQTYQFNWAPNQSRSSLYPPAPEIHKYLEDVADRHDLRRFMTFNTECILAEWDEESSKWEVVLRDMTSDKRKTVVADIFVYAVGRLNNYKIPQIAGQEIFQGEQVHTANWPVDMDVKGKRVVVIGNGASAVQCVAALQPVASKITNIARGPTWILPHMLSADGAVQRQYSTKDKQELQSCPMRYYDFCLSLEKQLAAGFPGLWKGTKSQTKFTSLALSFMESKIKSPNLLNALLPEFEAGCRRFTPGGHYLDALQKPNATYVQDSVSKLTENSLITESGEKYECDVLVYATGFEPYQPRFPVIGHNGRSLTADWDREGPCESYMAAMVAGFPNMFVFNPPICPVNGSAIPGIERASDYMTRILSRFQTDRLRSLSVREEAQAAFNKWVQSRMPHMVWSGPCNSWYKNRSGKVIVPWPGTVLHYYKATEIIRWEDFGLVYENPGDQFASFGNGVTADGFVPNRFPWLHPPSDFQKPEEHQSSYSSNSSAKQRAVSCDNPSLTEARA
ncbi:Flavin-containing monooxygenase-like [Penicillium camemberti]|uniref:Flavin-containing monooxygenase-like n=1 Tax=Penicillium camemberti (strain FM 013) TaxID=1429867 RepID=A0A0G4PXK6_PENC3|nr:Flavin-containing monooxygenase-like [Penicillium camemberti]